MRRTVSPFSLITLGLGTFLLVLAPLMAWYVAPRAAVTPIALDTTSVLTGRGSYFDTGQIKTVHDSRITITTRVRGDIEASERSGRAVWDMTSSIDTDRTLPASDPHDALDFSQNRWVTDRTTNKPVHCCKEHPYHEGDVNLKFPFDVRKHSYQWWDGSLGSTVTLHYSGIKKVQGYDGLRFTATVAPTKVGTRLVPGSIVGLPERPEVLAEEWYSNHGIELIADQRTGRMIYAKVAPRMTLRTPGSKQDEMVLLDSQKLDSTTTTQQDSVRQARKESGQLRLVSEVLPVGFGAAGFALAGVGSALAIRGLKRSESSGTSHSAPML
ncbi:DUF3068 domain-containing protein [Streptomyces sp. NPDC096324]|uniref:DUF3068 domain-containing protein n=1 Tax=Streptomyces sp. NPDC096324 TaxID=3366085 RepID=UPI00380A1FFC